MQLPLHVRAKIAALGELSRPLGEARAARIAEAIARAIARDVVEKRDPEATITSWTRSIAAEILDRKREKANAKPNRPAFRSLADVLPEVSA